MIESWIGASFFASVCGLAIMGAFALRGIFNEISRHDKDHDPLDHEK